MVLRVGTYLPESNSNGPGLRSVLWLQGCPKRCRGCWNPEFLSPAGGMPWPVEQAMEKLTQSPAIEGITLLGGEPFAQAQPLAELCRKLRERELSIMAYSGWTLEELCAMGSPQTDLLNLCDILVDGEYLVAEAAPLLWRGSRNQQVYFLTDRYRQWESRVNEYCRDFEIIIQDGQLILTGDPPETVRKTLRRRFSGRI